MTDLERINQSTDLQMALSEMLFKALDLPCWSKYNKGLRYICRNCERESDCGDINLFSDWTGFGVVWEAVKDRLGFEVEFYYTRLTQDLIDVDLIATPHFQLETLKWLVGADTVEKVVKEKGEGG